MDIMTASKQELINRLINLMVTPNIKVDEHTKEDESAYNEFVKKATLRHVASVVLPLDFIIKDELFSLIKDGYAFVESTHKFKVTLNTKRPETVVHTEFNAKYIGNEFSYSFLDNHPGIINIDKLKNIPTDYEGLMAVPPTVLEYKNTIRFNIHRVLYTPRFNGKLIYPRVVVSNKVIITD